jgi:dUTP pyrophosphatase|tara:strand:- start:442 stop:972 length:531 start_codon:yes stop_codon:yes gene_type:complete
MSATPTNDYNYLLLYTDNEDLKQIYIKRAMEHNNKIMNNSFPDAGFDLFCPEKISIEPRSSNKIDLQIKCAMYKESSDNHSIYKHYISYYMYPRSSISKTTLRLANSAGIIDSGYRGNLCGVFDNNCDSISGVDKYQRLLQICSPTLEALFVKVIDDLSFFENTDRGEGGFGSTGH